MKMTFTGVSGCVLKIGYIAFFFFGFAVPSTAQVSPNEILDPQLKGLEKQSFAQLKTINQEIAKTNFPFRFYLSRVVGFDPSQQVEADTRGWSSHGQVRPREKFDLQTGPSNV
jgi:hypothetical protein